MVDPNLSSSDIIQYTFKDPALLDRALTHASCTGHRLHSNERLEFLGDAILNYLVCEYLFDRYPDLLEGELTKIKSAVVSRKVCAKISRKMKLSSLLSLGKGMSNRPSLPGSISAAVLESVIAAIYLDGGIEPARQFIIERITPFIEEAADSTHQQNFKSVLQHYSQRYLPNNPTYQLLNERGPDHSKRFEVCVEIEGRRLSSGWGTSKKEAEQAAAQNALCELNLAEIDDAGQVVLLEPLSDTLSPSSIDRSTDRPDTAGGDPSSDSGDD